MVSATITSKHQVTIPRAVRREMNLAEGDQVEFEAESCGRFVLRKRSLSPLSDGAAVKYMKKKKKLSVESMKAAARTGAIRQNKRS
ncbi:MAG: AbrB/MazE/SpoVT family DNA-binding domain-containing protein [Verrucomicrobia bacterium]|jgi:AbrB family looped-hinge helix DNA binding protein|nr:AbrB/MazE/SpoVT family DNA-binding domain-containing protein [Verrucomicrobiota bacterium]